MGNIDKQKKQYIWQSVLLIMVLTLLGLLCIKIFDLNTIFVPLIISTIFAAVIELIDIVVWSKVAKYHHDSLPTFFMGASSFRLLAAIVVIFVYALTANNESIIAPFIVFMIYYFGILMHHSLFFAIKGKEKE